MKDYLKRINPIYRNLDDISSFKDIADSPYIADYPYLQNLVGLISLDINSNFKSIERLQIQLAELEYEIRSYVGADKSEANSDYNQTKKEINRKVSQTNEYLDQIANPYFGRIIFERKADRNFPPSKITTYIGKHAYFDKELSRPLITDWRAPITDLYYSNSGPTKNASFKSPAGEQFGDLTDKTQYEISMGRISNVYNSQTGNAVADAFLLSQLSKKIGKKLTDIVATIQDQQNIIIRDKTDAPMILQGVAGSGKTTILLHRIAYLLYANKETIFAENSLVIAPNKMFLDYISDILPSLGVNSIEQSTYITWAKSILKWEDNYLLSSLEDNLEVKRFKGSPEFIKIINTYVDDLESEILENINDPLADVIKARYYNLKETQPTLSMYEMLNLAVQFAFAQIQFKYKVTGDFFGDSEIRNKRQKTLLNYFKKKTNVYNIYKNLFKSKLLLNEVNTSENISLELQQYSLQTLTSTNRVNFYKVEDLAPILWIHFKLYGVKEHIKDYIAIDEAQDMSIFQLLCLIKTAKNGNVSIAGDLAQSIFPPFNITDWTELIDACEEILGYKIKYHQLDKCYRTTIEIIEYANKVINGKFPTSYKLPEAVLRHGEPVNTIELDSELSSNKLSEFDTNKLISLFKDEDDKGFATLAVICKDAKHADKVYENLQDISRKLPRKVYSYLDEDYHEGILVLPIDRAKGLEFDSVIVADMNENNYPKSFLNAKLFYVAVTRALHRLHVITNNGTPNSTLL
jgi:DNA helicase-2/ATP-dependent DNA helicase PcrA